MKQKPLKVGFDMDGVLLYNPARIVRPLISTFKKNKIGFKREELEFYVPRPGFQQFFWEMLHKSSCFLAPGFDQIKKLKAEKLIEPYMITGRFGHLKKDYLKWKKKMKADELFVECFMNSDDEQPHLFKERLIKDLGLEVFVEDNWDIVRYLDDSCRQKGGEICNAQVIWVSNILDYRIKYHSKVSNLKSAIEIIQNLTTSNEKSFASK